ncbi:MAG: cell division protein FtsQ [Pseudomonas sp.]
MNGLRGILLVVGLAMDCSAYADVALYPSGPSQDQGFIRFVNATDTTLDVYAEGGQTTLHLETSAPVSKFFPATGGSVAKGTLVSDKQHLKLALPVAPGEFVTVVALADSATGIREVVIREQPKEFNGLKASLAFINVESSCADPELQLNGREKASFSHVKSGTLERLEIKPVELSVQLRCDAKLLGSPLEIPQLTAGERYSVMLLPSTPTSGPHLMFVQDDFQR